ncbi:MAG TPA: UbiA family prenyltransferase [Amycolatopsis sp.]|nr:UbiA family prenyltransferase [Amycolatopsis sp.]
MSRLATRTAWQDFVVVHRLHFSLPVNYVCYAVWGILFADTGQGPLLTVPAVLAFGANLLLIVAPLALNVAIDVATDSQHADKGHLAGAARRFGRSRALDWAGAEIVAALAAVLAIGIGWGRWQPPAYAAVIVLAQVAYNVEPVRLKRRGLAGPAAFGVASVGLPCLLGYTAVRGDVGADLWPIVAGVSVLSVARTLWWSLPDLAADAASGIATPAVRYGLLRTHLLACGLLVAGLVLLAWGLGWRYGPGWAALGVAAHVVFLGLALAQLPATARGQAPSARSMLKQAMPVVTLGEVLVAVVALAG